MKLNELWAKADPFSTAMKMADAKGSNTVRTSFYQLPKQVQYAYLARKPYDSIASVHVFPTPGDDTIFIIIDAEGIEHSFTEDGMDALGEEPGEDFDTETDLEWLKRVQQEELPFFGLPTELFPDDDLDEE